MGADSLERAGSSLQRTAAAAKSTLTATQIIQSVALRAATCDKALDHTETLLEGHTINDNHVPAFGRRCLLPA